MALPQRERTEACHAFDGLAGRGAGGDGNWCVKSLVFFFIY